MLHIKYTALDIAKYIITKCTKDGYPISNLQLQKILYYIQKEYIQSGDMLFGDLFEAWQFGPVIPNVYYTFCGFGSMPIMRSYSITIDAEVTSKIDSIIEAKRLLDPWDMVAETHKINGAWDITYNNGSGNHQVIDNELIRNRG